MAKEIILKNGMIAIVDNSDFAFIKKHRWCAIKIGHNVYAYRRIYLGKNRYKTILMHREIMRALPGEIVDHKNRNSLDNRRSTNLRLCRRAQNARNSKSYSNNASGYRGVYRHSQNGNWVAQITVKKKLIYIGAFNKKIRAARAYDKAAKKYHGEFARLNFPD